MRGPRLRPEGKGAAPLPALVLPPPVNRLPAAVTARKRPETAPTRRSRSARGAGGHPRSPIGEHEC